MTCEDQALKYTFICPHCAAYIRVILELSAVGGHPIVDLCKVDDGDD